MNINNWLRKKAGSNNASEREEEQVIRMPFRDLLSIAITRGNGAGRNLEAPVLMAGLDALSVHVDSDRYGPKSEIGKFFLLYETCPLITVEMDLYQYEAVLVAITDNLDYWQNDDPLTYHHYKDFYDEESLELKGEIASMPGMNYLDDSNVTLEGEGTDDG